MSTGLRRAVPALRRLLELTTDRTWLLVENSAGAGGTIGRSLEELERLFEKLDRHPRLGLCLDSCHWWVSGVDVSDPDALAAAVADLDETIGLDRLRALHVNDALAELGSNRDRHASIGEGVLGERLGVFLAEPSFQGLPAILETPGPEGHGPDAAEMRRFRELQRRAMRRGKLKRRR
jgi:deoxyribonuclease-4